MTPLFGSVWIPIKDADPRGFAIFKRHYSYKPYKDGRRSSYSYRNRFHFLGPGEKLPLLLFDGVSALFGWLKMDDGQEGIYCSVFRNESSYLSSFLILEAEKLACQKWPNDRRFYTYVNSSVVASGVPGWCFLRAGYSVSGITKWNKLLIFEKCLDSRELSFRVRLKQLLTILGRRGGE